MSETTPDTGTDRVELTDAERDQMQVAIMADEETWHVLVAAVESIVAARVQALTAQRDRLRVDTNINADEVERQRRLLDLARAELAAANARKAELKSDVRSLKAIADGAKATLDRVTALADEWDVQATTAREDAGLALNVASDELRAALTPEGKREGGCGVCLTCDPPQDDPRFGFPIMQRMYVCGTCGNKRCPAAGDCLKWECSGSNATNQVPVPRTREGTE